MTETAKPERLVPISEGAEYLGVSTKTIRRWGDAGLITLWRVGPRFVRVDLGELANLAEPISRDEVGQ